MKKIIVLLAIIVALLLAMPIAAETQDMAPAVGEYGALAVGIQERETSRLTAKEVVGIVLIGALALIATVTEAIALYFAAGKPHRLSRDRVIHYARDQPAT